MFAQSLKLLFWADTLLQSLLEFKIERSLLISQKSNDVLSGAFRLDHAIERSKNKGKKGKRMLFRSLYSKHFIESSFKFQQIFKGYFENKTLDILWHVWIFRQEFWIESWKLSH